MYYDMNEKTKRKVKLAIMTIIIIAGCTGGCTTVYVLNKGNGEVEIHQSSKNAAQADSLNNKLEIK